MKRKQIAATGMVGVLLGAGSLFASTGGASATVGATKPAVVDCLTASEDAWWPGWTHLRPAKANLTTTTGVWMWHDGLGWHIRTTHRGVALRTLSGRLQTAGQFAGVSAIRLEGRDSLNVSKDHHVVNFRFDNHGAVDGLNFRTHCAPWIEFAFISDGKRLPVKNVAIGQRGVNPKIDPFTIARTTARLTR